MHEGDQRKGSTLRLHTTRGPASWGLGRRWPALLRLFSHLFEDFYFFLFFVCSFSVSTASVSVVRCIRALNLLMLRLRCLSLRPAIHLQLTMSYLFLLLLLLALFAALLLHEVSLIKLGDSLENTPGSPSACSACDSGTS